ncbi:MAG: glycosyltransferase family 4 protein [Paludibacteraceae bacterium]|nr:glycosyltransferase family 4 protein [Paludibacteraceae bacterium]
MSTFYIDAKRAFLNRRGLGNYSRDVIRLLTTYAPDNEYCLLTPKYNGHTDSFPNNCAWINTALPKSRCNVILPRGLWRLCPSLWRSYGCTFTIRQRIDTNAKTAQSIYWGLSGEVPYGIRRTGCKVVVTMHDCIFMRYPELYSPTYRALFARKVQYACHVADLIIAISEQTKQDLITFFHADENKIRVVYQGCNNRFREPITEEQIAQAKSRYDLPDRYLLDVGAIEPRKNLLNLIRGIADAGITLPLVAVGGKSAYAEQCRQEAERLGVNLLLRHNVDFNDFPALYKGAEVMCYPSIFEGFGIPILEAMCVGTPVLTSTGSCFAETGGEAALYADPSNPKQIGQQLQTILTDTDVSRQMREKGYRQAERFSDRHVAENMLLALRLLEQ